MGVESLRKVRIGYLPTFPTGNHAMLLNYWLATHGIDPLRDARLVTVPPSQMVAHLRDGLIDGFCAGEPWGERAVALGSGVLLAATQQVWPDHPGKVLGTTAIFAERHPDLCRALVILCARRPWPMGRCGLGSIRRGMRMVCCPLLTTS